MCVTICLRVIFYALRAGDTQKRFTFCDHLLVTFLMLCVLGSRSTVLPELGEMCVTLFHEPEWLRMTPLPPCERQPLWEGSERSKLLILSPPNGFLSRSLFHNPPHSWGERTG